MPYVLSNTAFCERKFRDRRILVIGRNYLTGLPGFWSGELVYWSRSVASFCRFLTSSQATVLPGTGEDYQVQAAVAQCPRSCIHYVTPSQRIVLEELLDRCEHFSGFMLRFDRGFSNVRLLTKVYSALLFCCSIIDAPYDTSAEADFLYSLIVKARFENNRYRKPKKQPRSSSEHVDWY